MLRDRTSDRRLIAGLVVVIFIILSATAAVVSMQQRTLARIEALATDAKAGARDAAALVAQASPCDPADAVDSPGCVRDRIMRAQVGDLVSSIESALARGIALHDANAHADHEDLRRILSAAAAPLPARTPITAAPRAAAGAKAQPTPATPAPTMCEQAGKSGRCK